jgi:transcriptional regulator GlxA family with amidase domain
MEQAAGLLEQSDDDIRAVARSVGYHDPYHFSHAFKAATGVSPSHYRARHRSELERK